MSACDDPYLIRMAVNDRITSSRQLAKRWATATGVLMSTSFATKMKQKWNSCNGIFNILSLSVSSILGYWKVLKRLVIIDGNWKSNLIHSQISPSILRSLSYQTQRSIQNWKNVFSHEIYSVFQFTWEFFRWIVAFSMLGDSLYASIGQSTITYHWSFLIE